MKKIFSDNLIFLVFGLVFLSALVLSWVSFRAAMRDDEFRIRKLMDELSSRTQDMADDCRSIVSNCRNDVLAALRNSQSLSPSDLEAVAFGSPLIRRVFLADSGGRIIYPSDDTHFTKHFFNLFYAPASDFTPEGDGEREIPSAAKTPKKRKTAFGGAIKGRNEGWLLWFSENRLTPIMWARSRVNPEMIAGAEIETAALLSRLAAVVPQNPPFPMKISLLDEHGRIVCSTGAAIGKASDEMEVSVEISGMLPNWKLRGQLDPDAVRGADAKFAKILGSLSLVAIVLCGIAGVFLLARREIILAGQKTSFVANVSHELKTPLTNIRLFAEMLGKITDLPSDKKEKYLSVILTESERLSRLISNVLDFSRIEAGEKKYKTDKVEIREIIRETIDANRAALEEKKMPVEMELSEEISVETDRDAFAQALQNLISNAMKYASSGGFLGVTLEKNDLQIRVSVRDKGPGIPFASKKKIFEKFYRCDDRLTAETRGTGLGLSIARRLMRDQGGDIEYSPSIDGGAIFTIIVPLKCEGEK
jgi:signal transduction histidine kinase